MQQGITMTTDQHVKATVMAAILGGTNMGQPRPTAADVRRLRIVPNQRMSLSTAVMHFWGSLMETDSHQVMFEDEARGFFQQLSHNNYCELDSAYPHITQLYDEAMATA
jgi:hypothetical protein